MQISITGKLGSGKSTVCKMIRDRYDYEIFSTGAIQREVAREMGISTLELNKRMKQGKQDSYCYGKYKAKSEVVIYQLCYQQSRKQSAEKSEAH